MSGVFKAVGKVVSSVLGIGGAKKEKPVAPVPVPVPVVSKPTVMPTADDAAVMAAKKRAQAQAAQRRGRVSTVLSQENQESFGG